ncbi:MAG: NAD(+) synthase [Bdellovibrio sp. SCN 50-8]|nr:MAG: NAD(+) synthase [Bdellovibrio sp. SCN 50-8]
MRIGVAQINPVLGDFDGNAAKIIAELHRAKKGSTEKKCDLVVFPESVLFGYHPFDLLERAELVEQQEKAALTIQKKMPSGIVALIGLFTKNPKKKGRPFFNSAALLEKGKKPRYFHKELLPTGDVFDEARFIEAGSMEKNLFNLKGKKFFLTICEDIWAWSDKNGKSIYQKNPLEKVATKGIDLVINMSASPFYPGKDKVREDLVLKTAKRLKAPMLYCNLVGAQDEIIFDGRSFIIDQKGKELMSCLPFEEDFGFFDLETKEGSIRPKPQAGISEIRQALVLGLRDFCQKTGLKHLHLGLSGGIDSAVVACLAVDALGASAVKSFYLPTEFSASESESSAKQLAKNLGIDLQVMPIQESFSKIRSVVDDAYNISEFGLVHENLQARIRGMLLMAYSNKTGSMLLGTSNKAELAAGYATLYGDLCGGLLPLGDLTKTQVRALADHYNSEYELIPKFIIERPPSAELRPDQKDEDSLPPYSELDKSVVHLVENSGKLRTPADKWLAEAILKSEFKRWQAPPILKVSKHSFGRGRRWPVAHKAKLR